MLEGLYWGLPVILYLFLAGLGAGACTVSASVYLRGGSGKSEWHNDVAKYGAFIAPWPVMIGCALLVLELGSFEAGHFFRWFNLYKTINLSPMSIGTWLLTFFIVASVVYMYTFFTVMPLFSKYRNFLRRTFAWILVPLGISVAMYTGVLLGAMPARPFWNSPILAFLFLFSSLSTGVAVILFARALFKKVWDKDDEASYLLASSDTILIGVEMIILFLFIMYAFLTVGAVQHAMTNTLLSVDFFWIFWVLVVLVGLMLPGLYEFWSVKPRLLHKEQFVALRSMEVIMPACILIGGFMLRYVVVIAGQITGPIGL